MKTYLRAQLESNMDVRGCAKTGIEVLEEGIFRSSVFVLLTQALLICASIGECYTLLCNCFEHHRRNQRL